MSSEPATQRRSLDRGGLGAIATGGLVAAVALFWTFHVWLSGREAGLLTSDVFLYYLPIYETLYGTLREGLLPLWNPYQMCGIPRLASLQAGFFYPGHVLYLILPVKVAFGLSGIAHLSIAAVAMGVLARRLGLGMVAAVAAALVLAIRGRYPNMVFFPNMLEAAAWLPVGAVAVTSLVRSRRLSAVAALASCLGLSLLAGYPQVTVYVVYAWGALLAGLLVQERAGVRGLAVCAALFAGALVLGAALGAVQLLPGWELTAQGTRSPGALTRWQQFPFGWYGPGVADAFVRTLRAPFPALVLSFGVVALAAGLAAACDRRRRALSLACLAAAAVVLLFAMGPVTPFFDWIAALPALGWFRFPRRSLFLVDFFVAILVAIGVQALVTGVRERFAARVAAPAWAWLVWLPAALLACEIFTARPNDEALYFAPSLVAVYGNERPIFTRIAESGERAWIRSFGIGTQLPPKLATYFRMRSIGDYEPLNLRRQADYFTWLMEGRLEPKRRGRPYSGRLHHLTAPTYPGALAERGHLLDVASVHWVVAGRKGAERGELRDFIDAHGLVPEPVPDPDFLLLGNPHAVPRAYVTYHVLEAPEPAVLMAAMSDPAFDPLAASYAEGSSPQTAAAGAPRRGHAATITRDDDTRVEVEAVLEAPGMLVLADSFYPGWHATVDGEERPIVAANHLFRGVRLPAGRHLVRFDYRPWTVPAGAAISGLAVLATAGLALRRSRRRELPAPGGSDSIRGHAPPDPEPEHEARRERP